MKTEVPSSDQVSNQVYVLVIGECIEHVDEKPDDECLLSLRVFELRKKLAFIHDGADRLLADDLDLAHFLHGVDGLEFLTLHFPHPAEATLAYHAMKLKVGPRYS